MRPIKILVVHAQSNAEDCGGSFGILSYFLKDLDRERFDAHAVLSFVDEQPQDATDSPAVRFMQENGVTCRVMHVPMNRMSANPVVILKYFTALVFSTWGLYRFMRREKFDVVYTNSVNILASGLAARLAKVKSIYHIHEIVAKPRIVSKVLLRTVGALADTIICINHAAQKLFKEAGVAAAKLAYVPNCIDLERFSGRQNGHDVRKEFVSGTGEKLVASIGRLVPKKGHHIVVEAAGKIVETCPEARILLVGAARSENDEYKKQLQRQVEEAGLQNNVVFTGQRNDMPDMMAAIDVAVLASSSDLTPESSPLVVLEAMAMGTPVVASNLGGIPELLHDTETGYLVPPRDADALAGAILRLLQDAQMAEKMGQAGQNLVRSQYSSEHYSAKIQEVVAQCFGMN
jgi:glycosyltransferase involved in cell wall biosynthesis